MDQLLKCWYHPQRVSYWYHNQLFLASHLYRKEKTKGQESSLVEHHFLSLPIWKIYYYLLHLGAKARFLFFNPSAWSDEHWSSQRKHHLSWCTLSLIRLYLNNIGSKCNRAVSCLFVKKLALLWCGRQLLEIISSFFFSALEFWVFFLQSRSAKHCMSWCTLSLIHLYLDNIGSKCNRTASCLFVKELVLLWCGRELLEIIS